MFLRTNKQSPRARVGISMASLRSKHFTAFRIYDHANLPGESKLTKRAELRVQYGRLREVRVFGTDVKMLGLSTMELSDHKIW